MCEIHDINKQCTQRQQSNVQAMRMTTVTAETADAYPSQAVDYNLSSMVKNAWFYVVSTTFPASSSRTAWIAN